MPLTYASVCSGIEAPSVAWHPLGWRPLWFAEIDPFPSTVLAHHYPDVPNYGDFTKLLRPENRPATPDVLIGGTPCQAFSVAGLRRGLADPRGNLALAFVALVDLLRPRWVVWENVPGVLSSGGGRDFGSFLGALAELGYGFAYRVLDAQYFDLAQRRARVFVVASPGDWSRPASVLLEPEGVRRDPPTRGGPGAGVAGALAARLGSSGADDNAGQAAHLQAVGWRDADGQADRDDRAVMVQTRGSNFTTGEVAGTLGSNVDRASGGAPCVLAYGGNDTRGARDVASAVTAKGGAGRMDFESETFIAHTLRAEGHDAVPFDTTQAVATIEPQAFWSTDSGRDGFNEPGVAPPLKVGSGSGGQPPAVQIAYGVRRLMPHELERLQGFPDGYTQVPVGKQRKPAADGPRAKALGNSMATPVIRWIGERIERVDTLTAEAAK